MNSFIGSLPKHQYIYVDSKFIYEEPCGFVPAVWFGLCSHPSRMWGLNVMLECGAVYRALPPHAVAFSENPPDWQAHESQLWDCYGYDWSAEEYTYLRGLEADARICGQNYRGTYLFTVAPMNDGFSEAPEQSKEFMFVALDNGRLTIQPTNRVRFRDASFTIDNAPMPKLKLSTLTYHCETQRNPTANPPNTLPITNSHLPNIFNKVFHAVKNFFRIACKRSL